MSNANDVNPGMSGGSLIPAAPAQLAPRDLPSQGYPTFNAEPRDYADIIKDYLRVINRRSWLILTITAVILTF